MALEPELSLQLILDDDRRRDVEQMSGETFQRIDVFDLEPLLYVLRYDIVEQ
ncbi:unknown [Tannerella sp. CAG:118]|nr:unknown [Tannerella sp. CAG:118]